MVKSNLIITLSITTKYNTESGDKQFFIRSNIYIDNNLFRAVIEIEGDPLSGLLL